MKDVVITGIGFLSPIGNTKSEIWDNLANGHCGIKALPHWSKYSSLQSLVAGVVRNCDEKSIPRKFRRTMGRVAKLAALATEQAIRDAELDMSLLSSGRTGIAMGSTVGSPEVLQKVFVDIEKNNGFDGLEGTLFMKIMSHTVAANTAALFNISGRVSAMCSACTSSTQSIGHGFELIRNGVQDVMICGGAEELHPSTIGVFDVLHATSRIYNDKPQLSSRPFDRDRNGLVISEAAAIVVLEEREFAIKRQAKIYGQISGYGCSFDSNHITQPGIEGMKNCIMLAVQDAGKDIMEMDYINAHATATKQGDAIEAQAIKKLVADKVPVSGIKGHTGHTLAACGALDIICVLMMMQNDTIIPTLNLENIAEECKGIQHVQQTINKRLNAVVSCNFAFGGINAAIVIEKV